MIYPLTMMNFHTYAYVELPEGIVSTIIIIDITHVFLEFAENDDLNLVN